MGIVPGHFKVRMWGYRKRSCLFGKDLMPRIRHCVECPKCSTRYLLSFSSYGNGAYLLPTVAGSYEEYLLYCSCSAGMAPSRWKWNEIKTCEVAKSVYDRGYGSPDEVLLIEQQPREPWTFDISRYVSGRTAFDRSKSSS